MAVINVGIFVTIHEYFIKEKQNKSYQIFHIINVHCMRGFQTYKHLFCDSFFFCFRFFFWLEFFEVECIVSVLLVIVQCSWC